MEITLSALGGSFGSMLGTLVLPGLVVAVGNSKAFAPSKSRKSQAQAAFWNLLFFGIPIAVWYANWCMGKWNWPSRF
jgi:hypothetical protein